MLDELLQQLFPAEGPRGPRSYNFQETAKILARATRERFGDRRVRRAWERLANDPCTAKQVQPLPLLHPPRKRELRPGATPRIRNRRFDVMATRRIAAEALHDEVPPFWLRVENEIVSDVDDASK